MIQTVPPIRNRHLVREIDRGRVRELLVVVMLAGLLLVPLLVYVWNHMEWIRLGYELQRLEKERAAQAELGERLRIEKASLASLARVDEQAAGRLGLVPAASVVRLTGEPERSAEAAPAATGEVRPIQTGSFSLVPPVRGSAGPIGNGGNAPDPAAVPR